MNITAAHTEAQSEKGPRRLTIPDHKDVIVGELAERGEWIVAHIRTDGWWPVNAQKVMYRGEAVWILPVMKGFYPAVAMKVPQGQKSLRMREAADAFHQQSVVGRRNHILETHGRATARP